jgi:hypothetical protein
MNPRTSTILLMNFRRAGFGDTILTALAALNFAAANLDNALAGDAVEAARIALAADAEKAASDLRRREKLSELYAAIEAAHA